LQILTSSRLTLRPLVSGDAARMFKGLRDPAMYFFLPLGPPASEAALRARYETLEARRAPDGSEEWLNWIIEAPRGQEAMGLIEATVRPASHSTQVGYFTFRHFWGQGFASEALGLAMDHLQSAYGVRLFDALADTRNAASLRVLEKLGFSVAETTVQADFFKGQRSDEHRLVKLAL
jgi:ribosomal-protein-alanine N-acetyltransferase